MPIIVTCRYGMVTSKLFRKFLKVVEIRQQRGRRAHYTFTTLFAYLLAGTVDVAVGTPSFQRHNFLARCS